MQVDLHDVVRRAIEEDVGARDLTTLATVPEGARARALITQKEPGVIYGLEAAELCFQARDHGVHARRLADEAQWRESGPVLELEGNARGLLSAERTALNLLQRLSGIATLTARFVREVEGTGAQILDTRKTTPGLRALEKAAVVAGGGVSHRAGLYDQILIKENHAALAGGVGAAVRAARAMFPDTRLEVECRTTAEVDEALEAGAGRILLDNMAPYDLQTAVEHVGGRAILEASGGITLETVRAVASSGVQFVSVGALTHSAPALDLSLILEPLP
jgi:nicotinate-nucleotide pyrophosphorylase (carboxylating)